MDPEPPARTSELGLLLLGISLILLAGSIAVAEIYNAVS